VSKAVTSLQEKRAAYALQIKDEEKRLERLEDLLIDGTLDREAFARKKQTMAMRLSELRELVSELPDAAAISTHEANLAELRKSLVLLYEKANRTEKRMIIENVWPNRTVSRKQVDFKPYNWVVRDERKAALLDGVPERDTRRELIALLDKLRTEPRNDKTG
jgi:hypothetical protein